MNIESITEIIGTYPIGEADARALNPQALAFVGDAIHTLYVRTKVATSEFVKTNTLHKLTADVVNATKQGEIAEKLFVEFNETEQYIFKRGRNYHTHATAKNATTASYHKATGLEAVLGYLFLSGNNERLLEVLAKMNEIATSFDSKAQEN